MTRRDSIRTRGTAIAVIDPAYDVLMREEVAKATREAMKRLKRRLALHARQAVRDAISSRLAELAAREVERVTIPLEADLALALAQSIISEATADAIQARFREIARGVAAGGSWEFERNIVGALDVAASRRAVGAAKSAP